MSDEMAVDTVNDCISEDSLLNDSADDSADDSDCPSDDSAEDSAKDNLELESIKEMEALIAQLHHHEHIHTDAIQRFQTIHRLVAEHHSFEIEGVALEDVLENAYEEAVSIVETTGKNRLSQFVLAKIDMKINQVID